MLTPFHPQSTARFAQEQQNDARVERGPVRQNLAARSVGAVALASINCGADPGAPDSGKRGQTRTTVISSDAPSSDARTCVSLPQDSRSLDGSIRRAAGAAGMRGEVAAHLSHARRGRYATQARVDSGTGIYVRPKASKSREDAAALHIQRIHRGHAARMAEMQRAQAAEKIQGTWRIRRTPTVGADIASDDKQE